MVVCMRAGLGAAPALRRFPLTGDEMICPAAPRRDGAWPAARIRVAAFVAVVLLVGFLWLRVSESPAVPHFPDDDYPAFPEAPAPRPLVGTNYTHTSFAGCSWDGTGILTAYHLPGVAERVHRQLQTMRSRRVGTLRLLVWHMRDVSQQSWGVVPSRGGRLPEPYRRNLVALLTEVRRFRFQRLTLAFGPQWMNSPFADNYDPERLEENWSFIRDVRALALEHGPPDLRFDLLNEGAPSSHSPPELRRRVEQYDALLWRRYADRFGGGDATISVIGPRDRSDRGRRMENLLDALEGSGAPLPGWFEIHLNYPGEAVEWGLRQVDSVLTTRGLLQPLTVGETSYDDAAVAASIERFRSDSPRPVSELLQWYRRAGAECEVSPPYDVEAYLPLQRSGAGLAGHGRTPLSENLSRASVPLPSTPPRRRR